MELPRLYSFRRCPYAIRARMALAYAGIEYQLHEVNLRHKPPELLQLSPTASVPLLQLGAQHVLTQSLDIIDYALAQHDPDDWRYLIADAANPEPKEAQAQAISWLILNDGPFKQALDGYKYPERTGHQSPITPRDQALQIMLTPLELQLSRQPYILGARPSKVDIALLPFVRQFAAVDRSWFATHASIHLPALTRWLDQWLQSPLFLGVMAPPQTTVTA